RGGLESAMFSWGNEFTPGGRYMANTWQGSFPYRDPGPGRFCWPLAGRIVSSQWLRLIRYDRQCLGMDNRLVFQPPSAGSRGAMLRAAQSAGRPADRQL